MLGEVAFIRPLQRRVFGPESIPKEHVLYIINQDLREIKSQPNQHSDLQSLAPHHRGFDSYQGL